MRVEAWVRRAVTLGVLLAVLPASDAWAAPLHPPAIREAVARAPHAVALAGPRVAWDGVAGRKAIRYLFVSAGGAPRVVARVTPRKPDEFGGEETIAGLAGSKSLLAWEHSTFIDDRLSYEEFQRFYVRKGARNLHLFTCDDFGQFTQEAQGLDVSGKVVALGRGPCNSGDGMTVVDYSRVHRPHTVHVVGRYPTGPIQLAGPYLAWREFEFFLDHIVVWDWQTGRELYRWTPPDEAGLNFDLQADGKLAVTYQPDRSRALGRVGWVSPQEQFFHPLPDISDFSGVFIRDDRIAYTRVGVDAHSREFPFAVSDLNGNVLYEIKAPRRSYLEDFDGQCAAWLDATPTAGRPLERVMVSPVPSTPVPITQPRDACSLVRLPAGRLERTGLRIAVPVQCRAQRGLCSGTLGGTADGGRPAFRTRFRVPAGRTIAKRVRVPAALFTTRHSRGSLRLRVWAVSSPIDGVAGQDRRTAFVVRARRG